MSQKLFLVTVNNYIYNKLIRYSLTFALGKQKYNSIFNFQSNLQNIWAEFTKK